MIIFVFIALQVHGAESTNCQEQDHLAKQIKQFVQQHHEGKGRINGLIRHVKWFVENNPKDDSLLQSGGYRYSGYLMKKYSSVFLENCNLFLKMGEVVDTVCHIWIGEKTDISPNPSCDSDPNDPISYWKSLIEALQEVPLLVDTQMACISSLCKNIEPRAHWKSLIEALQEVPLLVDAQMACISSLCKNIERLAQGGVSDWHDSVKRSIEENPAHLPALKNYCVMALKTKQEMDQFLAFFL
ncbi:MAG: hypothetical protein OXC30_06810 [Alphaproteobacteria bacterium]|nr:hypothetical protein [Alphaproteobacteria bacterium]